MYLPVEVVYAKIGNPAFCLALFLTCLHFRSELQHVGDFNEQKIKRGPIRTRAIGYIRLWTNYIFTKNLKNTSVNLVN